VQGPPINVDVDASKAINNIVAGELLIAAYLQAILHHLQGKQTDLAESSGNVMREYAAVLEVLNKIPKPSST